MKNISYEEVRQKLTEGKSSFKLINALHPSRFKLKYIPRSLNLFTKEEIEHHLKKDDDIVVYCTDYSCNKSVILYYLLESLGYKRISRFGGGLVEWEKMGLPVNGLRDKYLKSISPTTD